MKRLRDTVILFVFGAASPCLLAQTGFGSQEVITTSSDQIRDVFTTDLDGDGDADVLSAGSSDDKIAWYENLGGGNFSPQIVISTAANGAWSVYAADLDGDGDQDVLSANSGGDQIAWFENLGSGSFSSSKIISTSVDSPRDVYAADLDGDGDLDVLSASIYDRKVAWYENLGEGEFSTQHVISDVAYGVQCVYAVDLDGDGDQDVLCGADYDFKLGWYENLGGGVFSPQKTISADATGARSIYATDLDGDGDQDVLSASFNEHKIAWYENVGGGTFSSQKVITSAIDGANGVYGADLDGDGDQDVLHSSYSIYRDNLIAWSENLGNGTFSPRVIISSAVDGTMAVHAADLDGDGDEDAISASLRDGKIAWYENLISDCPRPTGLDVQVLDPTTIRLVWNPVAEAIPGFKVRASELDPINIKVRASSTNRERIEGVMPGQTFQWYVRSICNGLKSHTPPIDTFTMPMFKALESPEAVHRAYPNPATKELNLSGHGIVQLVDALGRTVWEGQVNGSRNVSVSDLKRGVYLVLWKDQPLVQRIAIQ